MDLDLQVQTTHSRHSGKLLYGLETADEYFDCTARGSRMGGLLRSWYEVGDSDAKPPASNNQWGPTALRQEHLPRRRFRHTLHVHWSVALNACPRLLTPFSGYTKLEPGLCKSLGNTTLSRGPGTNCSWLQSVPNAWKQDLIIVVLLFWYSSSYSWFPGNALMWLRCPS